MHAQHGVKMTESGNRNACQIAVVELAQPQRHLLHVVSSFIRCSNMFAVLPTVRIIHVDCISCVGLPFLFVLLLK